MLQSVSKHRAFWRRMWRQPRCMWLAMWHQPQPPTPRSDVIPREARTAPLLLPPRWLSNLGGEAETACLLFCDYRRSDAHSAGFQCSLLAPREPGKGKQRWEVLLLCDHCGPHGSVFWKQAIWQRHLGWHPAWEITHCMDKPALAAASPGGDRSLCCCTVVSWCKLHLSRRQKSRLIIFGGEHGKTNLQQALRSLDGIAIDKQSMPV